MFTLTSVLFLGRAVIPMAWGIAALAFFWGRTTPLPIATAEDPRTEMARLDRELASRPWLAGDSFSVADITALCAIDFGKISQIRVGDDTPHLARWYADMKARASYKA